MSKYLITRADDFGSAYAANKAILEAVQNGEYVKNVSCMAVGPHIDTGSEALEELHKRKGICIGLHAALNSEWDYLKFLPISAIEEIPSLVTNKGVFSMHPMEFKEKMPSVEHAIWEIEAQLDFLVKLGLTIEYIDTHMLPEAAVPGLKEALSEFSRRKGLIDHRWFYTFSSVHQPVLTGEHLLEQDIKAYEEWFVSMKEGEQYINILHPARYSRETLLFANRVLKGNGVAKSREAEAKLLMDSQFKLYCVKEGIIPLKYTEANPKGDTTDSAAKLF